MMKSYHYLRRPTGKENCRWIRGLTWEDVASHRASPHPVEISPADLAERQKRIGIEGLGQRLLRELPKLDARLQRDLENGSEHRLRCNDNVRRSEEPHPVDEPDQALLIARGRDLVVCEGVKQQIRRARDEVGIDRLALRDLACDALKAHLAAMRVHGGAEGGAAYCQGPQKR